MATGCDTNPPSATSIDADIVAPLSISGLRRRLGVFAFWVEACILLPLLLYGGCFWFQVREYFEARDFSFHLMLLSLVLTAVLIFVPSVFIETQNEVTAAKYRLIRLTQGDLNDRKWSAVKKSLRFVGIETNCVTVFSFWADTWDFRVYDRPNAPPRLLRKVLLAPVGVGLLTAFLFYITEYPPHKDPSFWGYVMMEWMFGGVVLYSALDDSLKAWQKILLVLVGVGVLTAFLIYVTKYPLHKDPVFWCYVMMGLVVVGLVLYSALGAGLNVWFSRLGLVASTGTLRMLKANPDLGVALLVHELTHIRHRDPVGRRVFACYGFVAGIAGPIMFLLLCKNIYDLQPTLWRAGALLLPMLLASVASAWAVFLVWREVKPFHEFRADIEAAQQPATRASLLTFLRTLPAPSELERARMQVLVNGILPLINWRHFLLVGTLQGMAIAAAVGISFVYSTQWLTADKFQPDAKYFMFNKTQDLDYLSKLHGSADTTLTEGDPDPVSVILGAIELMDWDLRALVPPVETDASGGIVDAEGDFDYYKQFAPEEERRREQPPIIKLLHVGYRRRIQSSEFYYRFTDDSGGPLKHSPWIALTRSLKTGLFTLNKLVLDSRSDPMPPNLWQGNDAPSARKYAELETPQDELFEQYIVWLRKEEAKRLVLRHEAYYRNWYMPFHYGTPIGWMGIDRHIPSFDGDVQAFRMGLQRGRPPTPDDCKKLEQLFLQAARLEGEYYYVVHNAHKKGSKTHVGAKQTHVSEILYERKVDHTLKQANVELKRILKARRLSEPFRFAIESNYLQFWQK